MPTPKISLNKLGEYLDATPARRRQIVKEQKEPQPYVAARYKDAREAIVEYIESGMNDEEKLLDVINKLKSDISGSEFYIQDKQASAQAIEDFLDTSEQIDIDGLSAHAFEKKENSIMLVSGVNISIRPDIILKDKKSGEIVGAIKLHFSKTHPLTSKSREYIATAIRVDLEKNGYKNIDHKKCYSVDTPSQSASHAPKAYKRKINDIEAACEEIAARWGVN